MAELTFLADAPDLSRFAWPDGAPEDLEGVTPTPTSWIQLAKVGKFKHPLYGSFTIDRSTFDAFMANRTAGIPTDEIAIDFDHTPDKGGPSRACGWVKELERRAGGTELWARIEWTWEGAAAIRDRTYRFVSPTWKLKYTSDDGSFRGPTLLGAGLTNRPWFEGMAVVTLSETFTRPPDGFEFAQPDDEELSAEEGQVVDAALMDPNEFEHIGFDELERRVEAQGHSPESAKRITAAIGRRKYGPGKMAEAARKGVPANKLHSAEGWTEEDVIFLASWLPAQHPRGAGGRFVPLEGQVDESAKKKGQAIKPGGSSPKDPDKIRMLQRALGVSASGEYDKSTSAAVTRFQKRYGLQVDGIAGRQTVGTLRHLLGHAKTQKHSRQPSDSRPAMEFSANFDQTIASVFGITGDITEEAILTAARELADKAPGDGEVVMTASQVADLNAKADKGVKASDELAEQRFENVFNKAVDDHFIAPAEKEALKELYSSNPDATIASIEARKVKIVPDRATGATGEDTFETPDGGDEQRFELHQRATTYARENKVSYEDAISAVREEVGV